MTGKTPYTTNKLTHICYAKDIRLQVVEHGIISPDWEWLLTSVIYDLNQLKELEKSLTCIENIMNEIWISQHEKIDFLSDMLKIPEWMKDYLFLGKIMMPVPLRWDMIYASNEWKIIEINTGFCLGGLNGFSVNSFRDNFYLASGSDLDVPKLDHSFYFLARSISKFVSKNSVIPVIETTEGYQKYGFYLDNFVFNMNKTQTGLYVSGTIDDFNFNQNNVIFKGHSVKYFIPMFNLYELNNDIMTHLSFLNCIKTERIISLLGFRELIFSNKAFIPYIIRYVKDTLTTCEAKEMVSLFPFSEVLDNYNISSFHNGDFILKPAEGYGGNGIVCSWTCQHNEWLKALDNALADDNLWIIQELITGEVSFMQSIDSNDRFRDGLSAVVHGLITLQGKIIGNLTRAAIGVQQPGIINAHQGAAFGLSGINLHATDEDKDD